MTTTPVRIAVVDVETTGTDPEKDAIVEVAHVVVRAPPGPPEIETWDRQLIYSQVPISLEAMAVHHITEETRQGHGLRWPVAVAGTVLGSQSEAQRARYFFAAHSAAFDHGFVSRAAPHVAEMPVICTWRCARHLWPDAPGYGNQLLRYWLGLDADMRRHPQTRRTMRFPPHRALPDAWITAHLLMRQLRERSPDELAELTQTPVLLTTVRAGEHAGKLWAEVPLSYLSYVIERWEPGSDEVHTARHWLQNPDRAPQLLTDICFGKHRGTLWADAPSDYLDWVRRQDFDADVMHTVRTVLQQRAEAAQREKC